MASPYETVRAELEEVYLGKRAAFPGYGDPFRKAWDKARKKALKDHGWTEEEFYAEMGRQRL